MAPRGRERGVSSATPRVEIVAIGTELLLGEIGDGNGAWLGETLAGAGFVVSRRTVVGDDAGDIRDAVSTALARTGLVLCSGGLGPTRDDLTKPVIADLFRAPLETDAAWLAELERRFGDRGITLPDSSRNQALVPRGALVLRNERGTAPGLVLRDERGTVILLPGVPHELRWLTREAVIPWLITHHEPGPAIRSLHLRTTGVPESMVAERVDDLTEEFAPLTLAFLPSAEGVDLRLTAWSLPPVEAQARLSAAAARLRERLGTAVFGTDEETLAAAVGRSIAGHRWRLALAESCTGGLISTWITDVPGASAWFVEAAVTYSDPSKTRRLEVPAATLARHGAVSEETALAMVRGIRRTSGAECGIAVTGIAGPGGGSLEKPVGTVWVAAAAGARESVRHFRFRGDRATIRTRSAQAALALLRELLLEEEGSPDDAGD